MFGVRGASTRSQGRKRAQGVDDGRHETIAATMSGVVENLQPAGGPALGQPPCGRQWRADVEASVDEHTRNPVQPCGVANELVVLEKRGVPPIMRHEAGEPE